MWTESWTFTWHHGSEWLFKRQCFLFTYVVMLACFLRFPGFVLLPQCGLFLEFSVYVAQFWFYFQYFLSVGTLAGHFSSVQLLSRVAFCDPMNCSTPGLPVHHQLLEPTQTHVHWVGDAIQPSHPLLSPSPAFNLSQHQGLFKWVSSSHQVAKVLEFQLQRQSSQWTSLYV